MEDRITYQMHPLNPYAKAPPDFAALCRKDERLARLVQWTEGQVPRIDFKHAAVLRAVTEATLQHDFGVFAELSVDRLCPPIPNRLNYVAWIRELLLASHFDEITWYMQHKDRPSEDTRPAKRAKQDQGPGAHEVRRILDVGTGASCIYPALGCALYPEWTFIATEIDGKSIEHASMIISDPRNNLEHSARFPLNANHDGLHLSDRVNLVKRNAAQRLLLDEEDVKNTRLDELPAPSSESSILYHATMCNPPFFSSTEEMQESLEAKAEPPNAICHGATGEMVCEGGELSFISRVVDESVELSRRSIWFTSMIGKLSTVRPLVEKLKMQKVDNYVISELQQGKTKRWAIAWSFLPFRIPSPMVPVSAALRSLQPAPGRHVYKLERDEKLPICTQVSSLQHDLRQHILHSVTAKGDQNVLLLFVARDTWSRKARRQLKQMQEKDAVGITKRGSETPALVVRIAFQDNHRDEHLANAVEVGWIYGLDRQLFDSFAMSVLGQWAKAQAQRAG